MSKGLDTAALVSAAEKEIEEGLRACQVAVAFRGEIVWTQSFGSATPDTRFWIASATKPIVSSAILLLIGDGKLDITLPVAHYLPEFAENGKQDVTVEQVLLMTCGFPDAPMSSADGGDPARRIAQLAEWSLEYEPGTRYVYHGMSAHWVLGALIDRISGQPFCDFLEERVTGPLGLPRLLGIPRDQQAGLAQLSDSADEATRTLQDYAAKIEVGEPGGGGMMTAVSLALFYQGLLHNPNQLWDAEVLTDGLGNVRSTLPDPLMNMPANRTLAVVVGRGFGATWNSDTAFGWPGYGGQIGFAEPATGVSFAFLQMGGTDQTQQFIRGVKMSSLALELSAD